MSEPTFTDNDGVTGACRTPEIAKKMKKKQKKKPQKQFQRAAHELGDNQSLLLPPEDTSQHLQTVQFS